MNKLLVATAGLALLVTNCGSEATGVDPLASESQAVRISWTAPGQTPGESTIQSAQLTRAESDWLRAARARARIRFLAGAPPVMETPPLPETSGPITTVASGLTFGSVKWSDCQQLDWLYMAAGANDTGDLFCAKYSPTNGFPTIIINHAHAFAPHYIDPASASSAFFNICTSGSPCVLTQCCDNGSCSGLWRTFYPNSVGGNFSPPSDATSIAAQLQPNPC